MSDPKRIEIRESGHPQRTHLVVVVQHDGSENMNVPVYRYQARNVAQRLSVAFGGLPIVDDTSDVQVPV